jgi:hypothetical protein
MASQLDEIRRLREQLAEAEDRASRAEVERDQARASHAELAGLTQKYIAATGEVDDRPEYDRQLARFQQGWMAAERRIDELHRDGVPHDQHGRMRPLEVPKELPEPRSLDEQIAEADDWQRQEAEWWFAQHGREQAQRQQAERAKSDAAELRHYRAERQARPKAQDREMAG